MSEDKYGLGNDDDLNSLPKTEPFKPGDDNRTHVRVLDRSGISANDKFALENQAGMSFGMGMFGEPSVEPKPTYLQLASETVLDSNVNAQIVIGPYNPSGILSPSIPSGETRNATIDLVAGRLGAYANSVIKEEEALDRARGELKKIELDIAKLISQFMSRPRDYNDDGTVDSYGMGGANLSTQIEDQKSKYFQQEKALAALEASVAEQRVYCNASYKLDSARVTICQRGNVDEDFGFRPANVGTSRNKSFVAVKGDDVRIHGRESIKIITGVDDENSQSGKNDIPRGIDLVGMNDDQDMQPIVKGFNLEKLLFEMIGNISDLNGIVMDFLTQQMVYNTSIAWHTHPVISLGAPTLFSPELIPVWLPNTFQSAGVTFPSIIINKYNLARNYLVYMTPKPGIKPGGFNLDIHSHYNRTN